MKLSHVVAKLTSSKAKVLGGLAVAGLALTAAAPVAGAQVAFGVQVGGPRYYAPAPRPTYVAPGYGYGYGGGYNPGYGREYGERRRAEEWRAQQWREHERFEGGRDRDFDRRARHEDHDWR